ncbi:carbonic anhydrase [Stereum hirsutum FP-91666 SS1]|uniref:carbonic anhydrase n=1 Tax=Stereum hirsutum (strain FP-91666) TaxID=721885 RepID=UPI000440D7FC|nr:carbonic anhydrase [Stereum hirsutum FP-91666 SS1]EIM87607.1 carbonic anhydrase [Stereum hirsutum FP-91666 SS1]
MDPTIARLFTSNEQWKEAVGQAEPSFFAETAKGQAPKVLWIGCADSRVPESVITASKPGDIFVHRNIANQFHADDDSALAVLSYAVENVGVEHVVIVGHTACGGAHACMAASAAPPSEPPATPLARWLAPLTKLAASLKLASMPSKEEAMKILVEENVKVQVANVCQATPVMGAWTHGKKVWVHGWVYELEHGRLRDLGISKGPQ